MSEVVIIDYGAGNVQSVRFALERLGVTPVVSNHPEVIQRAGKVIFPGVGEASSAMKQLRNQQLDILIPKLKQPVLGICLGMQLMCKHSEEGETDCLNIFPETVVRFEPKLKVPHVGWNVINSCSGQLLDGLDDEYVYYVHSYYVPTSSYTSASCNYITVFSAALCKGNFWGCQFHPEKSGKAGDEILRRFLSLN